MPWPKPPHHKPATTTMTTTAAATTAATAAAAAAAIAGNGTQPLPSRIATVTQKQCTMGSPHRRTLDRQKPLAQTHLQQQLLLLHSKSSKNTGNTSTSSKKSRNNSSSKCRLRQPRQMAARLKGRQTLGDMRLACQTRVTRQIGSMHQISSPLWISPGPILLSRVQFHPKLPCFTNGLQHERCVCVCMCA